MWMYVLTPHLYIIRALTFVQICCTYVWYSSLSPGFTQLYKCKLLQYLCCSILHTVPMAALRVEVEELTSPLITGNMPAGLLWPSHLPKWKNCLVFLEVIEELKLFNHFALHIHMFLKHSIFTCFQTVWSLSRGKWWYYKRVICSIFNLKCKYKNVEKNPSHGGNEQDIFQMLSWFCDFEYTFTAK